MKALLIVILGLFFTHLCSAQDLIILNDGDTIEARVTKVGTEVIHYKKFINRESSPIYEIYKNQVRSILYEDGSSDEFSLTSDKTREIDSELTNGNVRLQSRLLLGGGISLLNSYKMGNVLDFWRNVTGDNTEDIGQSTGFYFLNLGMLNQVSPKSWIGSELQIVFTPSHALWGTNLVFGGRDEIYFQAFLINVVLNYAQAVNDQRNVFFAIEGGLDIGVMDGMIAINNNYYEQSFTAGLGGHGAAGLNFMLGENLMLYSRAGYRVISIDEIHEDSSSNTGYSSFYVNGADGETVKVNWSGFYISAGVALTLNLSKD